MSLWMKSSSVTIQMKATEQYVLEVLFTMLYKVVLTFESAHESPLDSIESAELIITTHYLKLRKCFFQGFHCRGQAFITNQIMKWFLLLR